MTLAASRIVIQGETPYAHERAAIDFVIQTLPNSDPYHVWALVDLLDPSNGRLHEIDLLVLGYSTLFLVEMKAGPGLYTGDSNDWYRTAPGESRPRYMDNPLRLTNLKAKILASRLKSKMKAPKDAPFIQPLVFLSAPLPELDLRFAQHGDIGVVTRATFLDAMQYGAFPGSDGKQRPRINTPLMKDVAQAANAIGLRARRGKAMVGAYELGSVLADGPGFQDRVAKHRDQLGLHRRARIYAVPKASSIERRQQLHRAAERDAQLLSEVREHPNILRFVDYIPDAELGPTVLFEQIDGAMPLDAFLRFDNPSFWDRVTLVEAIARALSHCHKKGITHGALSPEAVLVRRHPETRALEVRVFNFQLGRSAEVEGTVHWSALGSEPWAVYQAPELREDPNNRQPVSDLFSLGALAYLVFTGRAPGTTPAEVDLHLARHECLDPRAVDDSLQEAVGELVAQATQRSPVLRIDDAGEWIELLLGEATRPAIPAPDAGLDPLEAQPGDALGDDLLVEDPGKGRTTLGQGATSRVLQVRRVSDDRVFALKVSLSPDHDDRLLAEAKELERLRHPRIVQLEDSFELGGRRCLLLSLAGSETLHRTLAREGTVSLERAARYGDDLLSALDHLEDQGVLHRDIKPANIGVGSVSNKAHHLTLFDFSLAATSVTEVQVGTAAYRDPFLGQRGSWDPAAERWSAAVTLHEMLTGVRPSFDRAVLDPDATLVIGAERFDASVRTSLAAFFNRALDKDVGRRFDSADAMRRAWLVAFEAQPVAKTGPPTEVVTPVVQADYATLSPQTPMEALPLSPRARNALDRAGILTAGDLLGLADNRLSAIRGTGTVVAKEIYDFKLAWAKAHADVVAPVAFFHGYRGEDLGLGGLDPKARAALADAGLTTYAAIAESPAPQVRALAHRAGFDERALTDVLTREHARADERARAHDQPTTLAGWVAALLPAKAAFKHARALYGIDGPFAGQLAVQVRALAGASGVTAAAIYIALGKARTAWAQHPALDDLGRMAHAIVEQAGGVVSLDAAARALGVMLHAEVEAATQSTTLAALAALLRVVVEVEKDEDGGLLALRLDRGEGADLWLCASEAHGQGLRALGDAADQLAARAIVPGPAEAQRAFADAVEGTPLATLTTERLADIGAAASQGAARSARLEIYPRGMPPERSLALSASQLRSGLTPAEIVRRVSLRYPEAAPVPERPALDALLQVHGLVFAGDRYVRQGEAEATMMSSRLSPLERHRTALPSQALAMDADAIRARNFEDLLKNAVERREFRVLGVRPDRARDAALALGARLGVTPIAFDQALAAAMRVEMTKAKITKDEVVFGADREGRTGGAWRNLVRLANLAAAQSVDELIRNQQVVLLTQPGLIARYQLDAFMQRVMAGPRAAAVLVLVPSHDHGAIPAIASPSGDYTIPGLLHSQVLWVPLEWLGNQHNRPAGAAAAATTGLEAL